MSVPVTVHPAHYNQGDVECIDAIRSALNPEGFAAFCAGNVIKYVWRYQHKDGPQDLKKAAVYLAWLQEATPPPAPVAAPAAGLVERVARAIHPSICADPNLYMHEARAAIREVAAWMQENDIGYNAVRRLDQEADR